MNQQAHDKASSINAAIEHGIGKLAWTAGKVIITLFLTAMMGVITFNVKQFAEAQEKQGRDNVRQDLSIQSLQQLTQSQQKVLDANSLTLRNVSDQVLRNTNSIEHIKDLNLKLLRCASTQPRPHPLKTVVILGNRTMPAHCACCAEAAKWKYYAEKLEKQLGMQSGDRQ